MTIYTKILDGDKTPTIIKVCNDCNGQINAFTGECFTGKSSHDDTWKSDNTTKDICIRCKKVKYDCMPTLTVPDVEFPYNQSQREVSYKYAAEWLRFRGWLMRTHKDREEWWHHRWGPFTFEDAVIAQAGREGYYHKKDGVDTRAESSKFISEVANEISEISTDDSNISHDEY